VVRMLTVGVWPGSRPVIVAFTVVVAGLDVRVFTRAAIAPTGPSTAAATGPQGTWSATLAGSGLVAGSFALHAAWAVPASLASLGRAVAALAESLLADATPPSTSGAESATRSWLVMRSTRVRISMLAIPLVKPISELWSRVDAVG
jgi:hypothetical protein